MPHLPERWRPLVRPVAVSCAGSPPVAIERAKARKFVVQFQQRLELPDGLETGDERGAHGLRLGINNDLKLIDPIVGTLANYPGHQNQTLSRPSW